MIKFTIVVALAVLASAEPEADAWYGPYGYSNWGNNMMMYGNNWNMMNNRPGMQEGYRFNYGKRSAEAEAEPEADAWYGPYRNNWGNNWPMMSGNNWPMMSYNNWNMNMMNRPGMQEGYRFNYSKRSAEAEADAWYGPYMNSNNWGYNGNNWWNGNNMNMMNNMNYMNNWNRPYNMYRRF